MNEVAQFKLPDKKLKVCERQKLADHFIAPFAVDDEDNKFDFIVSSFGTGAFITCNNTSKIRRGYSTTRQRKNTAYKNNTNPYCIRFVGNPFLLRLEGPHDKRQPVKKLAYNADPNVEWRYTLFQFKVKGKKNADLGYRNQEFIYYSGSATCHSPISFTKYRPVNRIQTGSSDGDVEYLEQGVPHKYSKLECPTLGNGYVRIAPKQRFVCRVYNSDRSINLVKSIENFTTSDEKLPISRMCKKFKSDIEKAKFVLLRIFKSDKDNRNVGCFELKVPKGDREQLYAYNVICRGSRRLVEANSEAFHKSEGFPIDGRLIPDLNYLRPSSNWSEVKTQIGIGTNPRNVTWYQITFKNGGKKPEDKLSFSRN